MFGRKKTTAFIRLVRADGSTLLSCPCAHYTLPEETQVNLSILYYNDPEPCEIHRGAVTKRALLEISTLCADGNPVSVSSLTELQKTYFPPETASVVITEEAK